MRDFLSFIIPGAIISSVTGAYYFNPQFKTFIEYVHDISFLAGMWILGISYLLGLTIQQIGESIGLIRHHLEKNDSEFMVRMKQVFAVNDQNLVKQRERYVVLKQAYGNNSMAFLISSIIILFSRNPNIIYITLYSVVGWILYAGHLKHLERQWYWENAFIQSADRHKKVSLDAAGWLFLAWYSLLLIGLNFQQFTI